MKYRKRPIEVEAIQMPSRQGDFAAAPRWVADAFDNGTLWFRHEDIFAVRTLEGVMTGQAGDYLIRGIEGELYPCRRSVFEATYELAGDAA